MSKSTFKGSLLATTVIAGMALRDAVVRAEPDRSRDRASAPVTPTDTQGNTPPAAPSDPPPAPLVCSRASPPRRPSRPAPRKSSSPVR